MRPAVSFIVRLAVLCSLCGWGTGCSPGPTSLPALKPGAASDGGPDPAEPPVAAKAPAGQPAPKKAAPPPAANAGKVSKFPKEHPNNVFIATEGTNWEIAGAAPRFQDEDRFTVLSGSPSVNSTMMSVAAAPPVTGSQRTDWQLPEGFTALPNYGFTTDGTPLRIQCEKDKSLLAFVPAGIARVGVNGGPAESGPEFVVFLDSYYMDVTEVTVRQFQDYRDALRDQKKRPPTPPLNEAAGGGHPVLGITWGDAKNYCRWAGKDLPTEAEFEKAGRGSEGFRAPWGNERPVWPRTRTPNTLTAVGLFPGDVSPYGICDLAGNAREWVEDNFVAHHQEAAQQSTQRTLTNWPGPKKPTVTSQRTLKGNGTDWALWHRTGLEASQRVPDVGFRGVLRLPTSSSSAATKKTTT